MTCVVPSTSRRGPGDHGYSLVEVMLVVLLVGIVSAMAVPISRSALSTRQADSATTQLERALMTARNRAIAERRNVLLTFIAPNTLRLDRQDINAAGAVTGTTTVGTFVLEGGYRYMTFPGVPDTPDAFGAGTPTQFSGTGPFMFTSDGSLVDSNGDVSNGTVFIGLTNQALSARAATVLGVTGVIRKWHWRGNQWME